MPTWAQEAITSFGYAAIFVLVSVEGCGVPLPGETALLVGAVFAGAGRLDIRLVIAVAAAAAIVGDSAGYWIGRLWGRQLLDRWGPRLGLTAKRVASVERFFNRFGVLAVFFGRYQALFRTYVGIFAGMARMPFALFFAVRAASCVVWALIFGLIAYFLGQQWSLVEHLLHDFSVASIIAGVVAAAGVATWFWLRRTKEQKAQ